MSSGYKNIDSTTISFGVAPRINACGRMGHADEALNLFLSKDIYEVNELTKKLNEYNKIRQETEKNIYEDAVKQKCNYCIGRKLASWSDWNSIIKNYRFIF